jgi:SAM-dependent methyltransferase
MRQICRLAGRELSGSAMQTEFGGFADEFLKNLLGIETLEALDYSDYQGASIIHDLNEPISPHLESRFDAVIDAGTIEHVFNFPVAIANLMKAVRPGGRLFIITVANNHCGHGFYQFSPELFFRLFKNRNGFHLERMLLLEHPFPGLELSTAQRLYSVEDPDELRYRIGLVTDSPVLLLLEAERRSVDEILTSSPLQSDYALLWHSRAEDQRRPIDSSLPHRLVHALHELINRVPHHIILWPVKKLFLWAGGLYQRHILYSFRNRKFYRRSKLFHSD